MGAMRPLSELVVDLSPEQAESAVARDGMTFKWRERFNPSVVAVPKIQPATNTTRKRKKKKRKGGGYRQPPLDKAWHAAHPTAPQPAIPPVTQISRLLRVQNEHFTVNVLWKKIHGVWSCVEVPPVLRWMKGMTPDEAKLALLRMDATFEWVSTTQNETGTSQPVVAQPTGIDPALS